jgi:DNA-binding transcriptional regulator YdaS (Cro superfamily)
MKKYSQEDVIQAMREEVRRTSLVAVADRIGVSSAYLVDVRTGRRPVSEKLARAFGFEREIITEVIFRKIA